MGIEQGNREQERLNALHDLRILEADSMPEIEALVLTLATLFDAPMAFLSFVDKDDLWFKASHGVKAEKTPRDGSFCDQAIHAGDLMVVNDALADDRFRNSRLVVAGPKTRFYAGYPLSLDGRNVLGTLCVVDIRPRSPSPEQIEQLRRLGTVVLGLLKSYRAQRDTEAALIDAKAQHLLAERKSDLLEEVTHVSGVGGWEYDIDSDRVIWTDKTREIHEVDRDFEPTVDMALSFYAPDCRRQISDAVVKAIKNDAAWDLELPFITAKGRDIWVRTAGRPIHENGRTTRLVGAFQDITERKRSEQLVRHAEAVQRTTLETLREGILVLNRAGRIQSFNSAAATLLGCAGEDLAGRKVQDLEFDCFFEDGTEDQDLLQRAARAPDTVNNHIAKVRLPGRAHFLWLRVDANATDCANEIGLDASIVSLADISETKSSEQRIRMAEAVQRTTLETLREGVFVLNRAGQIQSFNSAAASLLGYGCEDLAGRKVEDLEFDCFFEDGTEDPDLLQRAARAPDTVNNHIAKVRLPGQAHFLWLRVDANATDSANEIGLNASIVSLTDISETKQQAETMQIVFDNLPGGLVYYNDERRLTICNAEFQELLQLPRDFIDRQAPLREVAGFLAHRGDYGAGDPEKLIEERYKLFDDPKPHFYERTGANGRHLEVRGIPLPNGGLIANFFDITERKRSEHMLRHSEAVQRTTLEALSEGILLLSHSGEVQSANPAAIGLLRFADRQLVGMNVSDIDFGISCEIEGIGACDDPLERAARDPSTLRNVIARMMPKDGRPARWLRLSARPIDEDQDFNLDGVVVSLTDITETKQQADTLQSIFDNFPGGIVHYDETLRLSSSNEQFRQLLNYPKDLVDCHPYLYDFFRYNAKRGDYGPGDADELALQRYRMYDLKKPQVFERRAANGTYIETRSTPLPSGGLIHNFYDITERKQLEELLADNERQARNRSVELEAILANMRQGVSVFDKDGRLRLWNRQYIEIFGKPEGDVREGVTLIELIEAEKARGEFEGDVREHVMDLVLRLTAGEVVRSKFKHPNGKIVSAVHAPLPAGGWIGTHEDVTLREQAAEKIEYAAHHDTLTGLGNRTLFNARLDEVIEQVASNGVNGDLLLLDLDKFKPVNDTYGHDVGDDLLKQVAQRLRDCVRSSDLIARLGGDEFGIILTGTGPTSAGTAEIAGRIVRKLQAPFPVFDHLITIGVSVGISPITGDVLDPSPIIKRADLALYAVKNSGRNAYKFYEEDSMPAAARA